MMNSVSFLLVNRVATALLVAGLTLTLWMTGQTLFVPPALTRILLLIYMYFYVATRLAYCLFQLIPVT